MSLQIEISKANIQLDLVENCEVRANAFHMRNVLTNLIENSIKYSTNQAQINIQLIKQNTEVILVVADKGIGMSERQVKHAFDDFYRAQSGNVHATKGFGLGLTYCKMVAEKIGATIRIESKEGKGTSIFIKLITI